MALGTAQVEHRFDNPALLLGDRLRGIYRLLADEGHRLFPDDYFADMFTTSVKGRPTIPARVVATVMLLQAHEGLSDRDACDHLERDLAWQAAAGVDVGAESFHPTLLVGMRNRLRTSARPKRMFEDTKVVAKQAKVMGQRVRILDSTPIYDAVATQDTVTQLRSAIRKLLAALDGSSLAAAVRAALRRDDDYAGVGKPPCDWDDAAAREALVDALVKDALLALDALDGRTLDARATDAAELLALIAGQDVIRGDDGVFRIARRVAPDRVISTVDPEARHGHKSHDRRFDGYKAHLSVDPDSELIDEVVVTPANTHDAEAAADLLADVEADDTDKGEVEKVVVYGDSAYAGADTLAGLESAGFEVRAKVPPARGREGRFGKDDFDVDLDRGVVACPAGWEVEIRPTPDGGGRADFGAEVCGRCHLREACTTSAAGRVVTIHPREEVLQAHKTAQADPAWSEAYRSTRPKVERKIAHFTRVAWGGRRARTRGAARVTTDVVTRAAAVNLSRLATLKVCFGTGGWTVAGA